MHNKSVAELSRELESGKISSVELTRQFLGRLKKEDEQLNSFITITEEQALALRIPGVRGRRLVVKKAVGCPKCRYTGFRGRTGVFEVMPITPRIQRLATPRSTPPASGAPPTAPRRSCAPAATPASGTRTA